MDSAFPISGVRTAAPSRRVRFESGGDRLVADLYLPDHYRNGDRLPAVAVGGAWATVKEQMAGLYAAKLASHGFATLAFDYRGWGQSEGSPRQLEDPSRKTADIIAAAHYLASRPEVDAGRIGLLGICASAGYMAAAAATEPLIRSVALVAPWLHDSKLVLDVYGGEDGVTALIDKGRAAKAQSEHSGQPVMAVAASNDDAAAVMVKVPYYTEPARGLIPEWRNAFNLASWEPWLTFDAISVAPRVSQPVTMVHSEAAAVPEGARQFYAGLKGEKTQLWLDGVTQFDFYDGDGPIEQAVRHAAGHFRSTLG